MERINLIRVTSKSEVRLGIIGCKAWKRNFYLHPDDKKGLWTDPDDPNVEMTLENNLIIPQENIILPTSPKKIKQKLEGDERKEFLKDMDTIMNLYFEKKIVGMTEDKLKAIKQFISDATTSDHKDSSTTKKEVNEKKNKKDDSNESNKFTERNQKRNGGEKSSSPSEHDTEKGERPEKKRRSGFFGRGN